MARRELFRGAIPLLGRAVTTIEVAPPGSLGLVQQWRRIGRVNDAVADWEYSWTVLGTDRLEIVPAHTCCSACRSSNRNAADRRPGYWPATPSRA
jgi:hypothetical protein